MAGNINTDRPWFRAKLQQVQLPGDEDNGVDEGSITEQLQALAARVQALENDEE